MCGIAGIILHNGNRPDTEAVLGSMAHRGPDGKGIFTDETIFLAHTRLAIQDLSTQAAQPMVSSDGRYVIVFNGELYNHMDLRGQIPPRTFLTHSDTESLLYAYIHMGAAVLPLLNGIFAFAVYDKEQKRLFLARDAFGVKPLYYYHKEEHFSFASELKSIMALGPIDKALHADAFFQALLLQWPLDTAFERVTKLPPGHCLSIDAAAPHKATIEKWHRETFNGRYENRAEEDWIECLDTALTNAVQRQLLSDKPLAYFLSGGLDSSLLAAIARKLNPDTVMQAYTIDAGNPFREEGFSADLPYAQLVAKHLDIQLGIIPAQPDFLDRFDQMIWQLDEPQADVAPLFVQDIARLAKQKGFDVLIGGTGGDDIFSGYRRHQALAYEPLLSATPLIFRQAAKSLIQALPGNRRLKKAGKALTGTTVERLFRYFFWTDKQTASALFTPSFLAQVNTNSIEAFFTKKLSDIPAEPALLNQALHLEMSSFLPCHNLNYTDKMGMAEGVEIRVPYLDKNLVALAARIPPRLKMKGTETKYLLKKVAERYLPEKVIYRSKTGFGAPVRTWMQKDLLFQQKTAARLDSLLACYPQLFRQDMVKKLYNETISRQQDHTYTLLALLAIESWLRQFSLTK